MTTEPADCIHLTTDIVREIHQVVLEQFGGVDGVRDLALLESAVAAPQATFGGHALYADLAEVAAAYLFFLCRNHPFLDGNKRTALGACLVFLRLNGTEPRADGPEWEVLTMAVASGDADLEATATALRMLLPGA